MEISSLLRAKTFVQATEEKLDPAFPRERSLRVTSSNVGALSPRASATPASRRQTSYLSGGMQFYALFFITSSAFLIHVMMLTKFSYTIEHISGIGHSYRDPTQAGLHHQ